MSVLKIVDSKNLSRYEKMRRSAIEFAEKYHGEIVFEKEKLNAKYNLITIEMPFTCMYGDDIMDMSTLIEMADTVSIGPVDNSSYMIGISVSSEEV